ncbi:hypothetical protein R3W88_003579 [Solanum pinnatisectum]|uniref:Uncharacterized protein n=1 Tax=Solanum pinnatisectum TaxID=50273 RepID=A0AAV9MPG3_9SOLN|nr:hypothetical protein R3W88_003579 [Solanum pinnatisectum]
MYKQSPSRNHRSKGVKVKNVLQICLLLAVCFWLIYQVKHSHDKKKEFDEDDAKSSIKTGSSNELMKLGRKDLPRIEGLDTVDEKHREEPEDEIVEEEEEGNKPEEEDLEENNTKEKNDEHREDGEDEVDDHDQEKNDERREDGEDEVDDHEQEKNDEHREDGEDEVDDHDQEKNDEHREDEIDDHDHEKSDVERDQEVDAVDEDKEQGEDNEKETEVNDSQVEEENSLEDHDHDEDSSSSHEAREEHYKADDASSAVTHDTVVTTTENDSGKLDQEVEHSAEAKSEVGFNNIMQINASQNTSVALKEENGKADEEDSPPNTTNSEEKHDDPILSTAADTSVSNSTRTEGLTDNSESRTYSTELSTQTYDLLLQNGTQAVNLEYNATVGDRTSSNTSSSTSQQSSNSADTVDDNQIDSNLTFSSKNNELDSIPVNSSNVSGDTEPSLAEKVVQGNATTDAVDNEGLPLNDNNATEDEKADTSSEETGTTDEDVDASIVENLGEVQDDLIDTSDSSTHLEEKHVRTDVETLPEIQTEGSMEDAAAE